MRALAVLFFAAGVGAAPASAAEDARAEVDAELSKLASVPPTLEIRYVPLAQKGYELSQAAVEIDGQKEEVPDVAAILAGTPLFASGVKPGLHEVEVRLVLVADFGLFSYRTGYKFKLAQHISLETRRGLLHVVEVHPEREPSLAWERSLVLSVSRKEQMLAALENGDLPPPPKPNLPTAVAAAGSKVEEAAEPETAAPEPAPPPPKKLVAAATRRRAPVKLARATPPAAAPRPPEPAPVEPPPPAEEVAKAEAPPPAQPVTMVQALSEKPPEPAGSAAAPDHGGAIVAVAALLALCLLAVALVVYRRRRRSGGVLPPSARGAA